MSSQSWSNGRVGTIGCSSTAEWQLGVAALGNPAFAAMIPQSFGAGVGRVAPYYEQGNWYRGGAVQMLFITWLYGEQNQVRPIFPSNTSQEDLIRASKAFDLAQQLPPVDWSKALWHLPEQDILKAVDAPRGIYADAMPIDTGGRMIRGRRVIQPGIRAGCTTMTCRSIFPVFGSCPGTTYRSGRISRFTITFARWRNPRSLMSSGRSLRLLRTADIRGRQKIPSLANEAWAMRGSSTRRLSTAFSTAF